MTKAALLAATAPIPSGAILMMAAPTVEELEQGLQDLHDKATQIVAKADTEERDLTDAEIADIEQADAAAEKLEKQIKARKAAARPVAGAGRRSAADAGAGAPNGDTGQGGQGRGRAVTPTVRDARGGFGRFGEFAMCVLDSYARNDAAARQRLVQAAATTYGNEQVGGDGGYLVPTEFRQSLWQKVQAQELLLNRCEPFEIAGNNITIPKDETSPWDTTNGIQVYWESEGAPATASKPKFETDSLRLAKVLALVPISEELMSDAPGLESWLRMKAPQKIAAKVNTAIIRGNGVGKPLGILNAPCLISVTKETSQPADTVYFGNINKMWSRMYAPCRSRAVWVINQDVEPQLDAMAFDPAATSKTPVYLPPGGLSTSPYASLKGRPVVPVEACSTVGDQGDIILADFSQYMGLRKAGQDIQTDVSIHLYFDQALQAFRFILRVNGMPLWGAAIDPENGTNTRSCFVTLDQRS